MRERMKAYKDIDEYISTFPKTTQEILQKVRRTIQKAAPEAAEKISYGIPTFHFNGNLVHFAAYEHHIGFYPGAAGIATFLHEMDGYTTSKGTVQFPLNKPIPYNLIEKITSFRVEQNKNSY